MSLSKYWTFYYRKKDGYHQIVESTDVTSHTFRKRLNENRVFKNKAEARKALYERHNIQNT